MPDVSWFDCCAGLGRKRVKPPWEPSGVEALLDALGRTGVAEALVYHSTAVEHHPAIGNEALMRDIRGHANLRPCWVLLPPGTRELPDPPELVAQMIARGVRAARLAPVAHGYDLNERTCGPLFDALAQCSFPLFIDRDQIGWTDVDRICGLYPKLPVILTNTGYGITRHLYPLLGAHANLCVELSRYEVHNGLEDGCRRFGARHFLFGSGWPTYVPGCTVAMVGAASIPLADKRCIAGDNLRQLLQEVRTP